MKRKSIFRLLSVTVLSILAGFVIFYGCSSDDDDQQPRDPDPADNKVDVAITFKAKMGGQDLSYDDNFDFGDGDELSFHAMMFFVSDVYAVKESGEKELLSEIELIDFDNAANTYNIEVSGKLPKGDYTKIAFGSGVKESLNNTDPAEFDLDHPLNTTTGMYWTWATNYIFHKFEGRIHDPAQDTSISWFFHTGLDDLYYPDVTVERNFTVSGDAVEVPVILNLDKVFNGVHQLDLWNKGQTHTTDEREIAEEVAENISKAFE